MLKANGGFKSSLNSLAVANNSGLRLRKRWAGFSLAFCVMCAQSGHVSALAYFVVCTQERLHERLRVHHRPRSKRGCCRADIYFFGVGCALCVCLGIRTLSPMFFEAHVCLGCRVVRGL